MTAYVPIPVAQVMWSSYMDRYDRLAMKATLNLNDHILRQAKGQAAQDGVTLTRFVEEALRAKLAAARGGPIALVEDGDPIRIDLPGRKLDLEVAPEVLAKRLRNHSPRPVRVSRGYLKHYCEHVAPASEGAVMPR